MVKKSKNPKKSKTIALIILFVAVAFLVFGIFMLISKNQTSDENSTEPETTSESSVPASEESSSTEPSNSSSSDSSEESSSETSTIYHKVSQYESKDPNSENSLTGSISAVAKAEDGSSFSIYTTIDQFLDSGTCTLEISKNGSVLFTVPADILPDVSTSYCNGFYITAASLGGSLENSYDAKILLTSGDKSGTIESGIDL